jgi:hypothetical protein
MVHNMYTYTLDFTFYHLFTVINLCSDYTTSRLTTKYIIILLICDYKSPLYGSMAKKSSCRCATYKFDTNGAIQKGINCCNCRRMCVKER